MTLDQSVPSDLYEVLWGFPWGIPWDPLSTCVQNVCKSGLFLRLTCVHCVISVSVRVEMYTSHICPCWRKTRRNMPTFLIPDGSCSCVCWSGLSGLDASGLYTVSDWQEVLGGCRFFLAYLSHMYRGFFVEKLLRWPCTCIQVQEVVQNWVQF